MTPNLLFVGTYTAPRKGEGIVVFRHDLESGALTQLHAFKDIAHPSFLALDPGRKFLFAVNEHGRNGEVSSFRLEPDTGVLTFLNRQSSMGSSPCHLSTDPSGKFLFVANYGSGSVAAFPVGDDGMLEPASDLRVHGTGGLAHYVGFDPSGKFLAAVDKGLHRVFVYRLDAEKRGLIPHDPPFFEIKPGGGPRHLVFHPKSPWAYVNGELDLSATWLKWDAERGAFEAGAALQTVSGINLSGVSTAEIVLHPTGKFLYVSVRGHHSIAVLGVGENGELHPIENVASPKNPRHIALDPAGRFLYAAGQDDDRIVGYRVDSETGKLEKTEIEVKTGTPVCLLFA